VTQEFDQHIAISRQDESTWVADLDAGWSVGGGVNGGYLLAVVGNALRQTFPSKPDPIAISAYYLSATAPGKATVHVDVRREGGSVATAAVDLRQGEDARITALATYADLDRLGDDVRTTAEEPHLPPPDQCAPNTMAPPEVRTCASTPTTSAGRSGSPVGTAC